MGCLKLHIAKNKNNLSIYLQLQTATDSFTVATREERGIGGGKPGSGFLAGLFGSAVASSTANAPYANTLVGGTVVAGLTGFGSAEITGGNPWEGAAFSMIGYITNQNMHKLSKQEKADKINTVTGAFGIGDGFKSGMLEGIPVATQEIYLSNYIKYCKTLGLSVAVVNGAIIVGLTSDYYLNRGGTNPDVAYKASVDLLMLRIGFFFPEGTIVSGSYFILDKCGVFGNIGNPITTPIK